MNQSVNILHTARNTVLYNMEQQGYNVDAQRVTLPEMEIMCKLNQLDMLLETPRDVSVPIHKTYIRFLIDTKISIKQIQKIMDELTQTEPSILTPEDTLFIVSTTSPNISINEYLKQLWDKESKYVAIETIARLQYNILQSVYVPKHTVLTKEEADNMLRTYRITDVTQLPKIKRFDDPVARALCIRPHQIVRIERPSKTAVISLYYRLCE